MVLAGKGRSLNKKSNDEAIRNSMRTGVGKAIGGSVPTGAGGSMITDDPGPGFSVDKIKVRP